MKRTTTKAERAGKLFKNITGEIETLRVQNAELLEAIKLWWAFMDSLPHGWLGKTSGDVGLLNDAYLKSRAAIAKAEGK